MTGRLAGGPPPGGCCSAPALLPTRPAWLSTTLCPTPTHVPLRVAPPSPCSCRPAVAEDEQRALLQCMVVLSMQQVLLGVCMPVLVATWAWSRLMPP